MCFCLYAQKKCWVFVWKWKTEIKTKCITLQILKALHRPPFGCSILLQSLSLSQAPLTWDISSGWGLIKVSCDCLPLRGGHQGAPWQGKVWLKLRPGGGSTAMTIWPSRVWGSSSESGYFLFLMLLLKSCLLWLSFPFSAWLCFWCYHFGDLAGCPCRIRGLYSHLFISAGFSGWVAKLCEETWDSGNGVSSCSSSASLLPLQLLNSRTDSTTVKACRISEHQKDMTVQGPARTELGFATTS